MAELGSLSKASDTLRVAQPALSRQIKLLEHELRTELFTRNGRGMVLTDAGRLLLARTSGIVRQIDQIRDDIQSAQGPPSGRVVLGLVPTKGIPLPLISSGGSSLMISLLAMGVLLNVSQHEE